MKNAGAEPSSLAPGFGQYLATTFYQLFPIVVILALFAAPVLSLVDNTVVATLGRRKDEYLPILSPETYLREHPLRIVDRALDEITQIGDSIQVTGAEKDSDDYRYFANKVRCSGPYWGVNQISAAE